MVSHFSLVFVGTLFGCWGLLWGNGYAYVIQLKCLSGVAKIGRLSSADIGVQKSLITLYLRFCP